MNTIIRQFGLGFTKKISNMNIGVVIFLNY